MEAKLDLLLLNTMLHAPMGRFQLELIYCFTFIFHRRPICRPFVVITTLSTGLVGVEVTSTPTIPVDNVVIATNGLQDRNTNIIAGTTVENKGKLILTEIFPSVQKHDI